MRKLFFFIAFLMPFMINAQNYDWDISYMPGGPGGCSNSFDEIVYPLESFIQSNCCSDVQNGTVFVDGDMPLPQTYKITSVSFEGLPASVEVSARVRTGVGNNIFDVFRSDGEVPTLQNTFQRDGDCNPSCFALRVYFKFGPIAAPPNTNATATFNVNYCNGSICDEFAFPVTVPVNLLEKPFFEYEEGPICVDDRSTITIKRNNHGPQNVCSLPFDSFTPKEKLVWTTSNPNIRVGKSLTGIFTTNKETIKIALVNPVPTTGLICVSHTPWLQNNIEEWYVPNEQICQRVWFDDCDYNAPSIAPLNLRRICSYTSEPTCYTYAPPCIDNIKITDNDPFLQTSVGADGRTICIQSNHPCEATTSQVTVTFKDKCGNISSAIWNIQINRDLICCDEDDPRRSNPNSETSDLEEDSFKTDQLSAFPNPFQDEITINLQDIRGNVTNIVLLDASGSKKLVEKADLTTTQHRFNLENFQPGVYIVMVYRKDLPPVFTKVVKTF